MILFYFDCILQLKKSYHIATNVCSRKSATTFGDLPDWRVLLYFRKTNDRLGWISGCVFLVSARRDGKLKDVIWMNQIILYHPDKNTSPEATALFQELN